MARIYPETYREDPDAPSEAERLLYHELRDQLPDDVLVFHRRPWHAPSATGSARDGEADFVIAGEKLGILVLEARSGGVARDAKTGAWYAVGPEGRGREIDDPIQLAARRRSSLARRLRDLPAGTKRAWTVGHAVAFPQIAFTVELAELPPEIVLDLDDVPRLKSWVERAMRHWGGPAPGPEGVDVLSSLLAVGFEIRPILGQQLARHEHEIARLTNEQYHVLDGLARYRRVLISGCAGSGKTMLALEKVRRLAEQGWRALFVCFNTQLRDSCRAHLKPWPNVAVDTFHGLCADWVKRAGVRVERKDDEDYFDRALPEGLAAAAKKIPDRFDAIVVDEGQDFQPRWWGSLQSALKDAKKGVLYVFYDDNQTLYNRQLEFPAVDSRFDLPENCRNLRRIHDIVVKYYKGDRRIISRASPGESPQIVVYRTTAELLGAVEKALGRLARDHKIGAQHIAVLTGHGKEKSAVWRAGTIGGFRLTTSPMPADGEVFWSSVHAFKGLERAAVILAEIEPPSHAELDTLLYVGCSRARVSLTVIASETAARLAGLR